MPQIDVILKYASRADAIADLLPYVGRDDEGVIDFSRDSVLPNIQVWRASQDVGGVHQSLPGYFVLVSLPRVVAALRDNSAVQFVVDRDKANARQAGAVLRSTVGAAILQDLRFSPIFAGTNYPWGAWQ